MQQDRGSVFLRLLLNQYFTGKQDMLPKLMPKEDWDKLATFMVAQKDPNLSLFSPKNWLGSVDISWIVPTVQTLPKELQETYAKVFPKEFGHLAKEKAAQEQAQNGQTESVPFSDSVKEFLLSYLHAIWSEHEVTPKELLPHTDLAVLLNFNRQELLEIVDLLAMHDLVEEMRHIVDKRLLQSILQYLTQNQQHYLRILLRQKSRRESSLSVRELLKEGKKFPQLLHKFGLQRLANALSGQDEDFIWHLLHTFDTPRAKFLKGYIQKEAVANQTHNAELQVQHIIQFLKTETPP